MMSVIGQGHSEGIAVLPEMRTNDVISSRSGLCSLQRLKRPSNLMQHSNAFASTCPAGFQRYAHGLCYSVEI